MNKMINGLTGAFTGLFTGLFQFIYFYIMLPKSIHKTTQSPLMTALLFFPIAIISTPFNLVFSLLSLPYTSYKAAQTGVMCGFLAAIKFPYTYCRITFPQAIDNQQGGFLKRMLNYFILPFKASSEVLLQEQQAQINRSYYAPLPANNNNSPPTKAPQSIEKVDKNLKVLEKIQKAIESNNDQKNIDLISNINTKCPLTGKLVSELKDPITVERHKTTITELNSTRKKFRIICSLEALQNYVQNCSNENKTAINPKKKPPADLNEDDIYITLGLPQEFRKITKIPGANTSNQLITNKLDAIVKSNVHQPSVTLSDRDLRKIPSSNDKNIYHYQHQTCKLTGKPIFALEDPVTVTFRSANAKKGWQATYSLRALYAYVAEQNEPAKDPTRPQIDLNDPNVTVKLGFHKKAQEVANNLKQILAERETGLENIEKRSRISTTSSKVKKG